MNEWGEAMAIEPSNVYGYRWLETIQRVKQQVEAQECEPMPLLEEEESAL